MQPGRERTLAAIQLQLRPRPYEDVLCQLLGERAIGDHARAYREDAVDVRAIDALERYAVALCGERYVLSVGSAGGQTRVVDCRHHHPPVGPRSRRRVRYRDGQNGLKARFSAPGA